MNRSDLCGPIPSEFVLLGLSWLGDQRPEAGLLFLLMYLLVILANCGIIILVRTDRKLHKPMHIFISLLALTDLSVCSTVVLKVLAILFFDFNTISSAACLTQMYVLYSMLSTQSALYTLMSFDRYMAICHPLRHSTIVSMSFIGKSVLFILSRSTLFVIPIPAMAGKMRYSRENIINNSYCDCSGVLKLSCEDLTPVIRYIVFLICIFPGGDTMMVLVSYMNILKVIHMLKSSQARWKSLSTCSSHIILLSLFYISCCFPLVLFLYFPDSPPYLQTFAEVLSFLLLPMINPVVYGVRSKEIQDGFKRLYWKSFKVNG